MEPGYWDPPMYQKTGRVEFPDALDHKLCPHVQIGINLYKLSSKLQSLPPFCETCRPNNNMFNVNRRTMMMMQSKPHWICLSCGHFSCGDVGVSATTRSHAQRHAKIFTHPLAIHHKNHQRIWCFQCDKPVDDFTNPLLHEVAETLKSSESATLERSLIVKSSMIGGYRVRGLLNLGNTCFFNSVMQSLFALTRFRDYFLDLEEPFGPISDSLRHILDRINGRSVLRTAIDPSRLFDRICNTAPHFRGYNQHDSHELLRCLLDALSTEETRSRSAGPTFVDGVFGGRLSSSVRCLECGHASTMYESFLDLSLSIPMEKPPPPPRKGTPDSAIEKVPEEAEKAPEVEEKVPEAEDEIISVSWLDDDVNSTSLTDTSMDEDVNCKITTEPQSNDVVSLSLHPKIVTHQFNGRLFPETCYISQHSITIDTTDQCESDSSYSSDPNFDSSDSDRIFDSSDFDAFRSPDPFKEPDVVSENNSDPALEEASASTITTMEEEVDINNADDDDDAPVSVERCLALFMKPEHLSKEEHAWNCDNCKVKRDATKSVLMDQAPPILTVQLKRFNQDARGHFSKLSDHVEFRETVDLKPYMDSRSTSDRGASEYRLVGVVEHGGSMGSGHYVAYVRVSNKGSEDSNSVWFHASDAYVREVSFEKVLRSQAYILFYEAI